MENHKVRVMAGDNLHRAYKIDAQAFDRVDVRTAIRWKESHLSGDEFRISAVADFYRNGAIIFSVGARDIKTLLSHLPYHHDVAVDDGKGWFAGEGEICDQEGCDQKGTIALQIIKGYSRDGTERRLHPQGEYRLFCDRHKHRGDCALEDNVENYKPVPFTTVKERIE